MNNYVHMNNKVIYIDENIPGPFEDCKEYQELINAYNSQLSDCCSCTGTCVYPKCSCLLNARGSNYIKVLQNEKFQYKISLSGKSPVVECNSQCSCSKDCGNRLVQKGPIKDLLVKSCVISKKGLGLFSSKLIPSGSFICEYAGELLTKSQAVNRNKYNENTDEMNYVFCLNEICNGIVQQTFVDPTSFGNIGCYINHSCDPNCEIVPVRYDMPIPRLAIFSITNIFPDMEITFNYSANDATDYIPESRLDVKKKKCLCSSINCKKVLPYNEY